MQLTTMNLLYNHTHTLLVVSLHRETRLFYFQRRKDATPCISLPAATALLKALCKASPAATITTAETPERRRIAATAAFTVPTGNISFAFTQSVPTSRASSPSLTR